MRQIFLAALLSIAFSIAKSQTPESLLQKVQQQYATEKIYFHYDKSFYIAGETVWFKAYIMEGYLPSAKSTVIAIELINDSGSMLDKKILPINGSTAIGEFSLPKNLPQGSYTIKAYTRNLMNFGFDNYYYHHLNVFNPETNNKEAITTNSSYTVVFFPEAGNLIGHVKNTIAFKCTNNCGTPKDIEGQVTGPSGKEVASFKSTHDGMGTFSFVPEPGEQYIANCTVASLDKITQPLPVVLTEGVVLTITRQENKTFFLLDATTVANENLVPDYILGVMENLVAFKVPVPNTTKRLNGEIPTGQLPTGILQLTVFNKANKPLAERLMFINSGDYLPAGVFINNKVDVKPRGKNSFSFDLQDTIAGTFSVSVTDADVENKQADNIVSRFLLTSDIRGIVHNPSYYFENNDALHQQNLDLVMLTNGWRRYSWNELLADRFPSMAFIDPGYIAIGGQAIIPATGKPLESASVSVLVKTSDKKTDFLMIPTDSVGKFFMDGISFEDTAKFYFTSNQTKNSKINTKLSTPGLNSIFYSIKTPLPKLLMVSPDEKLKAKLQSDYVFNKTSKFQGITLDEIKLKAKLKSEREKYEKKYVSGRMGNATKTLDFLTDPPTSNQNILNYLKSKINGVDISGGPLNYSIVYRNGRSLSGGPIQMNIFLDEFEVDAAQIATMSISDVALINVYSSGGLSGGAGGSLAIYTKKGGGSVQGGVEHQEYLIPGFSPTKEFFSPNYESASDENILNDERSTLYWDPYLLTNAQNKSIHFSFFNSDKAKKFRIILEGILEDGKLLHVEKIIE
ncbi:MAG: hypothetical protein ABI402_02000 [Ferruginibacter sp.]